MPPAQQQTVETFSITLTGFPESVQADTPAEKIEERLLAALGQPTRLLRWAIVETDGQSFRCEGAYLKSADVKS